MHTQGSSVSTEKHKNEQRDAVDNCISPFSRDMPKYYGEESEMEINSVWHQHESSQFESISSKSLPFKKPEDRNGKISIGAREQPHTREESELEIKNSECFQNRSSRSSHDQRMSSKSLLPKYKDIQHTHVISAHKTEGSWTDPQIQVKPNLQHNTKMASIHFHKREAEQYRPLRECQSYRKTTAQSHSQTFKERLPQPSMLVQKSGPQLSNLSLIEILRKPEIMNIEELAQWFDKLSFKEQNEVIELYRRHKSDVYHKLIARSKTRTNYN